MGLYVGLLAALRLGWEEGINSVFEAREWGKDDPAWETAKAAALFAISSPGDPSSLGRDEQTLQIFWLLNGICARAQLRTADA